MYTDNLTNSARLSAKKSAKQQTESEQTLAGWWNGYIATNPESLSLLLWLLLGGAFIYLMRGIITPLLLSIIAAYLMNLLVGVLEQKWHISHQAVVPVVFLLSWGVLLYAFFWLIPPLIDQLYNLINSLPKLVMHLKRSWLELVMRLHLPDNFATSQHSDFLWNHLASYAGALSNQLLNLLMNSLYSLGYLLFYLIIVPIFSYFLLRDRDQLLAWLSQFWPAQRRQLSCLWRCVQIDLLGYLRGKVLEALLMTGLAAMLFALFGLQYAILLAVMLGVSVFVPYLGVVAVSGPVMIIAFLQWGFSFYSSAFLAAYVLLNIIEGQLLAPMLFAKVLSLHPLAIILAVFCFGYWFGFWGVLLAIPFAALIRLLLVKWPQPASRRSS